MKVTQKAWIRAEERSEYNCDTNQWETNVHYTLHEIDMTGTIGWVVVSPDPITVEFEVPDSFHFGQEKVKDLQEQQRKLEADFERRRNEITAQINRYLCLEAPKTANGMDILDSDSPF